MKTILSFCATCVCALLLFSCSKGGGSNAAADAAMKADSIRKGNIDAYMKVTDMLNTGKMDDLGKYIAESFTEHQVWPGQKPGLAGMKESMTQMRTAYPDMKFTINSITADSNMIWALSTMTGTNSGPMMGMPPTNKKINVQAVDIVRLENGKCVEHWGFMEEKKMMQQLGMMPPDPAPGAPAETKH